MKIRTFPDKNYKAVFHNGKTLRMAIDPTKPVLELEYPEFYDISLSTFCDGECPYCYQNNSKEGSPVQDACQRLLGFFGGLDANQRPFQVALSGLEYLKEPEKVLVLLTGLGIVPNYTTNGKSIVTDPYLVALTKKYCGGVAVTAHSHLSEVWPLAVKRCINAEIFTNIHILIHDRNSVDEFIKIYAMFSNTVKYFVLLPVINQGRAQGYRIDSSYLFSTIKELLQDGKIALGANFYEDVVKRNLDLYLYEPEIFSKYLDLSTMKVYKSSFNVEETI